MASQFHPEFLSKPHQPHPLFKGLAKLGSAAVEEEARPSDRESSLLGTSAVDDSVRAVTAGGDPKHEAGEQLVGVVRASVAERRQSAHVPVREPDDPGALWTPHATPWLACRGEAGGNRIRRLPETDGNDRKPQTASIVKS